uniref:Ion_trans domain-containing protein n=1 Tax=Bursaphelenchus xylophilus TaxID=6326 RepID=A0A1I7SB59_BURXY
MTISLKLPKRRDRSPSIGRRLIFDDPSGPGNQLEWAPPVRVVAVITLFASTLDLFADFLLCSRLAEFLANFQTETAKNCAYGYFFFTGVSMLVYVFEMVDVCLTLKHDEEDVFFARLAKSLVLCCEEVPLPALLYVLFTTEPRLSLADPVHIASWIKLITLSWGIVKFSKLRFFWPFLVCNPKHERRENIRRMFNFTLYRCAMVFVNICHFLAIFIVINNLIASGKGGKPITARH